MTTKEQIMTDYERGQDDFLFGNECESNASTAYYAGWISIDESLLL